jgi:diguanylate cyclase (GGDEF)-like protein
MHSSSKRLSSRLAGALLLLALSVAVGARGEAGAAAVEVFRADANPLPLTPYVEVARDVEADLSFADIRPQQGAGGVLEQAFHRVPARGDAIGFSYTGSAIWLRVRLDNPSDAPMERVLEVTYALLAELDIFLPGKDGVAHLRAGYAQSRSQQLLPGRYPALPLSIPAQSSQWLYLRARTDNSLNLPLRLWAPDAYDDYRARDMALQGLYFGVVLAIGFYNLMLFLYLRDSNYLLYVLFAGSVALALATFTGVGPAFVWGQAPYWTRVGVNISAAFAGVAMLLFAQRMLETADYAPVLHRCLQAFLVINAVFFVLLWRWFEVVNPLFVVSNMATSLLILFTGLRCMLLGQRSARYFVAAFTVFFVANALTHLRNLAILPTNFLTRDGMQIGSAMEMLLLSLVLADRFNALRREKMQAQQAALAAEQELVRGLRSSEKQLEAKVRERTRALEAANRRLQTLSTTDALTQLANRRRFEETLEAEWRRALRRTQPLTVGMIDVDDFKAYNDRHGHRAGDACLAAVASVLANHFNRAGELVARYGGEEFVFIVPGMDEPEASELAERVRGAIEALSIPRADPGAGCVTVSIGVASTLPTVEKDSETLLRQADTALYAAKAQGRNRSLSSSALPAPA